MDVPRLLLYSLMLVIILFYLLSCVRLKVIYRLDRVLTFDGNCPRGMHVFVLMDIENGQIGGLVVLILVFS